MKMQTIKNTKRNIDLAKLELMASILKAISHPLRLEIIELLEDREALSVAEIRDQIDAEQSLLSHHLIKMKDKGVLKSHRKGRHIYYTLAFEQITKIFDCMDKCDIF